jgi:hypothetical protein
MDVQTAPLLVKRRGMKRQRSSDGAAGKETGGGDAGGQALLLDSGGKLCPVPEGNELLTTAPNGGGTFGAPKRRPTTLDVLGSNNGPTPEAMEQSVVPMPTVITAAEEGAGKTPGSAAAFTEYRDTKPLYLKYSRDDLARGEVGGGEETDTRSESGGGASSAGSSTITIQDEFAHQS